MPAAGLARAGRPRCQGGTMMLSWLHGRGPNQGRARPVAGPRPAGDRRAQGGAESLSGFLNNIRCCLILLAMLALAGPAAAAAAAAPPNLNGQWRQDDEGPNLILIAQDHDAVLVIFDGATPQGEKITYYGSGTISGRKVEYNYIFTRAPKGWKNGDMSLSLSKDGNVLTGHWDTGWDRGKVVIRRVK